MGQYANMTNEEIGQAIRKKDKLYREGREVSELRYEIYKPMTDAWEIFDASYRGKHVQIRFAHITPTQMLQDIYIVEESLKEARKKICAYIDARNIYENNLSKEEAM